ncbi:hypothetical protein M419DRAFT_12017 [Trichoderma reesei RUT C-30]|uniref:Fido domain-containing protein n=1 Tax=Hypocrea jecorina (strain ATCC 56765 / BCRC 32924 / NRRL 11460 / Rut C-30) TaxID=1344414 RepID=A0A024RYM5_HYPJR|nr:hypothetical protein M419DRAFT_12017 [Trichoderma reesei RUT C-30]
MSLSSRLSRLSRPGLCQFRFHFHSHLHLHLSLHLQQRIASLSSASVGRGRDALLRRVYAPFAGLAKGSPEYTALAQSGRVWEDYFQPADSDRYGYIKLQQQHADTLDNIDDWKRSIKAMPSSTTIRSLVPYQLAELRNHIIASHWVTEAALRNPGTAGIAEDEIRCLSAVLLKDTRSEVIYKHAWGKRVLLGDYRSTPIGVKSNPLRIFPYHDEVPACMRRFTQWRDKVTRERRLHPLIAACQMTAYFLHIHPFLDGNGRVSRLLMQDYMVRHGYVPVVIQGLDRRRYIDMISRAQDGKPDDFVTTILRTELEELKTLELRKMTTKHGVS